jgi:hypothetical protein
MDKKKRNMLICGAILGLLLYRNYTLMKQVAELKGEKQQQLDIISAESGASMTADVPIEPKG